MFLKAFVTFFGVGLMRPAPGTWGSVAGWIVAIFVLIYLSPTTLFLASILLALVGISAVDKYEKLTNTHDSSHIVIDEVAGVWLALSVASQSLIMAIFALVIFRMLDISKPSVIGMIDKKVSGGLGVMGDDVVAGFIAGIFASALYFALIKLGVDMQSFDIAIKDMALNL
ncbi:phosphatidylglycerophosphatase A [Campylobacter sp. 19-13652]|uniref:phosphatidylglycerophosphatase A family protein n=1 Tax=Campylobacter sp. 19-13652 TaxID=2840180 RepID=UPI001C777488|nr:phosphatidylglycerophosphatase A [Campylobacter sp. 19-13652]BCX79731.1 phosphatidylglycerophosphatase A [Campylobacter sp. 19-13652]